METELTCVSCGTKFPVSQAKCKMCDHAMDCEAGTCMCQYCKHKQPMDQMLCPECLEKNRA